MSPPKGGGNKKKKSGDKGEDVFPRLDGHQEGPKFLVVRRMDIKDASFEKVSPIFIHKGIKIACGEPLNTVKLRDGSLLVKTKNIAQANQLLRCKMLGDMAVRVEESAKLNQTRGIITNAELRYATMEEIADDLSNQGVCHVEQMKRKRSGVLEPTNSLILTSNSSGIPETVKVGYLVLTVRILIPRPIRCYKCQYYGHPAKYCSKEEVCSNCYEEGYQSDVCSGQTICRNCKSSSHFSWSTDCSVFKSEQEIVRIKATKSVSMREAKNRYKARNSLNVSYRDVLRGSQSNSNVDRQTVTDNKENDPSNTTQTIQKHSPLTGTTNPETFDRTLDTLNTTTTLTKIPQTKSQRPGTSFNSALYMNTTLNSNDDDESTDDHMEAELQKPYRPRSETSEEEKPPNLKTIKK
ncbi:uncharacterized protein LOC129728800 [Wyeomyia smithii]|uniref:uncharacterized protein LOC129728800 n=1 Tax=Wyeomyia smithii TaxID=174621 RepID=UPI002467CFA4|nr:uncharacterized protein LOC129728800 [Wyeomyia smithii]